MKHASLQKCIAVVLALAVWQGAAMAVGMDLLLPWPQLLALCVATVLAGTATAWLAARAAARHDVVLAVKEDW